VTLDPSTLDTGSLPFSQILHLLRDGGCQVRPPRIESCRFQGENR
jgi:hypothetical protein